MVGITCDYFRLAELGRSTSRKSFVIWLGYMRNNRVEFGKDVGGGRRTSSPILPIRRLIVSREWRREEDHSHLSIRIGTVYVFTANKFTKRETRFLLGNGNAKFNEMNRLWNIYRLKIFYGFPKIWEKSLFKWFDYFEKEIFDKQKELRKIII